MKNIKNLMFVTLLSISAGSLLAEKKARVYITNNYGQDVALHLTWRSTSFMGIKSLSGLNYDRHQDVLLKEHHQNYEFAAPVSAYKLYEIDATPASNLVASMNQVQSGSNEYIHNWDPSVGDQAFQNSNRFSDAMNNRGQAIDKSLNHDVLKVRNETFFIIENSHKKSDIAGQDKIRIKEFASQQAYEKESAAKESSDRAARELQDKQAHEQKLAAQKAFAAKQAYEQQLVEQQRAEAAKPKKLSKEFMQHYYGDSFDDSLNDETEVANIIQNNQSALDTSFQNIGL